MILMDKTKETVTFEFEGKVYQMTSEEIEAAYRYREREYRQSDAEVAIEYFAFGSEDPETRPTRNTSRRSTASRNSTV